MEDESRRGDPGEQMPDVGPGGEQTEHRGGGRGRSPLGRPGPPALEFGIVRGAGCEEAQIAEVFTSLVRAIRVEPGAELLHEGERDAEGVVLRLHVPGRRVDQNQRFGAIGVFGGEQEGGERRTRCTQHHDPVRAHFFHHGQGVVGPGLETQLAEVLGGVRQPDAARVEPDEPAAPGEALCVATPPGLLGGLVDRDVRAEPEVQDVRLAVAPHLVADMETSPSRVVGLGRFHRPQSAVPRPGLGARPGSPGPMVRSAIGARTETDGCLAGGSLPPSPPEPSEPPDGANRRRHGRRQDSGGRQRSDPE